MDEQSVFSYITSEKNSWRTERVPLTNSKSWNMYDHIERCTNVSNAWFNRGSNEDGLRPYDDIVTPIINVAFRSEGFDVKDIVPYVDSPKDYYKSFLVKKYHPQWARKYEIDTFIDEVVETSIIYDLVLVKNVNNKRPEVVDLKTLAFCDQTDVMAGPICIKHQYTPAEMMNFKGKWDDEKIDLAVTLAPFNKESSLAHDQKAHTPGKYIDVYELRGNLPESWLEEGGDKNKYTPQMWIVCFYTGDNGQSEGITLYKGVDKPLSENFKALKIDAVRSKGRACGRSIVETLFEPQVWRNYDAIKIKKLLDAAITVWQTDSDELAGQKLSEISNNTILKHEQGRPLTKVDGSLQNLTAFTNDQVKQENQARILGSASDAQLGTNPVSGTPFSLQQLVVQQGQGLHEYRQGKIATFFSDVLYRDWILGYLVEEMNKGKDFSEELTLEEVSEIAEDISTNMAEQQINDMIFNKGKVPTEEERETLKQTLKQAFIDGKTPMYSKGRGFFKMLEKELDNIPVAVMVNVKGKQRYMAQNADKISNMVRTLLQAGVPVSAMGNQINELLEESGMSPIRFAQIISPVQPVPVEGALQEQQ